MPVIGSAEVLIRPTFPGFQREVKKAIEGVGAPGGRTAGSRLTDSLKKWGTRGAVVAGGAIAGVLGASIAGGFSRLKNIENAEAKLRGLGHSAESVQSIMDNALAAVKGTAFGLDEAATVAASAVAAGVQPGEDLERTLGLVGDAATIAGVGMGEMGSIFNKVATGNRVTMQEINQLGDAGIPIMQMLGDQMGVTAGEVREMVTKGEVDFDTFRDAIETNVGGAALESGNTTEGAFANLKASISRVGANLLSSIFPKFKDGFTGITEWLGPIEDKAKVVGEAIGEWLGKAADFVKDTVAPAIQGLFDLIVKGDFTSKLREAFGWEEDSGAVATLLKIRDAAIKLFGFIKDTAIPAAKDLFKWMDKQQNWLVPIAAGIGAIIGAWKIYKTTILIVQGVTKIFTAVQAALNAVLNLNPIGIVVLALVGLVAAFVVAYKKSETFRKVVDAAWAGIKKAAKVVWEFLRDKVFKPIVEHFKNTGDRFRAMKDALVKAWDTVKSKLKAGWDWIKANVFQRFMDFMGRLREDFKAKVDRVRAIWDGIKSAFKAVVDWVKRNTIDRFIGGVIVLRDKVQAAVQRIKDIWSGIKSAFKNVVDWVKTNVIDRFKNRLDGLLDKVRTIRDRIGDAWKGIANKFRNPINWVINTVWNDGIAAAFNRAAGAIGISTRLPDAVSIPAFAKGGRHRGGWALVGEEGPELVNFSQPGRVYTAAETQAALGAPGPVGDLGGTISDIVGSAVGAVTGWVRGGLASAAGALLNPLKSLISNTVGQWGTFGRMGGDIAKAAIDGVIKWISGKDDNYSDDGTAPPLQGGWRRPSRGPITSEFGSRWGAFHAGIDIAGGGPTYAARAGQVAKTGWNIGPGRTGIGILIGHGGGTYTYYGHNPPGGVKVSAGDAVKSGQRVGTQGATGNVTGTHVHFELHRGGAWRAVNPRQLGVFDQGGMLAPGAMAINMGSKPEPVLTPGQWDKLAAGRDSGVGQEFNFNGPITTVDVDAAARAIARKQQQAMAIGRYQVGGVRG